MLLAFEEILEVLAKLNKKDWSRTKLPKGLQNVFETNIKQLYNFTCHAEMTKSYDDSQFVRNLINSLYGTAVSFGLVDNGQNYLVSKLSAINNI